MSGYQTVSIDYDRLLGGIVIVREKNKIILAYSKSAMSIVENAIYAHDSERKWIQNHPIIVYEIFLVDHCIKNVQRFFDKNSDKDNPLFSASSISERGNSFGPVSENDGTGTPLNISLLSDIDILYYIKNVKSCQDVLTREFFDRNLRRHPIWKSEEEYKYFLRDVKKEYKKEVAEVFSEIPETFKKLTILPVINDEALETVNRIIAEKSVSDEEEIAVFENAKEYFEILKKFAVEKNIGFDFVIIPEHMFKSNFSKIEVKDIKIYYPYDTRSNITTKEMESILTAEKLEMEGEGIDRKPAKGKNKFFYLYYKRKNNIKIEISEIVKLCEDLAEAYIKATGPK